MRFLSLFSGIEAASQAWLPLGWKCVGVAEIEKFPCAVLKHRHPDVPNLGDVTKITREQIEALGNIDVAVGGFPCQDLSVAGQRKGLKHADGTNTRSGLFFDACRIAEWSQARWTVVENVPGLFSSNEGRDFATVVGELAGAEFNVLGDGWRTSGVALGERGFVEWFVLDAQYFGLAQRRQRVFIVRDSGGQWQHRPPFLPLAESMSGHPPPRRETGERIAPSLAARTKGGGGLGTDAECDGAVIPIQEIGKRQNGNPMNGVGHGNPGDPMFTLQSTAEHGVAIGIDGGEVGYALRSNPSHSGDKGDGGVNTTLIASTLRAASSTEKGHSARAGDKDENLVVHSLRADGFDASEDGTGRGTPLIQEIVSQAMSSKRSKGSSGPAGDEVANMIATPTMAVRRLTPKECERLQGFPDDYTLVEFRGKPACDGVRYKALGNSFAVPVVAWIGNRIQMLEELVPL